MINQVTLVGRLTKDPELKLTSEGTPLTNIILAINRSFKNANGQIDADFVQCTLWRKIAVNTVNYCRKGSVIGITGRIQTRNYENVEGRRVYVTEVIAETVQFLGKKQTDHAAKQVPHSDIASASQSEASRSAASQSEASQLAASQSALSQQSSAGSIDTNIHHYDQHQQQPLNQYSQDQHQSSTQNQPSDDARSKDQQTSHHDEHPTSQQEDHKSASEEDNQTSHHDQHHSDYHDQESAGNFVAEPATDQIENSEEIPYIPSSDNSAAQREASSFGI